MENVKDLLRTADALFTEMNKNSGDWDELRRRIMPRMEGKARQQEQANEMTAASSFSPVAHKSLLNLASAHLLFITPMDQKWFSLRPQEERDDYTDEDDWYSKATEAVYRALADSNFYAAAHEVYLDRCLTGTGCMFADVSRDGSLVFKHVPTGTYAIAEGAHGEVNTLVRTLKFTAQQAVEMFKLGNLPVKIQEAYKNAERRYTEMFEFVHLVLPNSRAQFGSDMVSPGRRKWLDVYIAREAEKIVFHGGFYEFPFLVTRFLKGGVSSYGEAPGKAVLPEIKATLLMDRVMDVAGSRAAIPSVIVSAKMAKEVDLRAGGKTVVPDELISSQLPREWANVGDVRFMLERQDKKEKLIREAFFNDILQVVSSVDREMTATEVNARESERIICFFSSFIQFSQDFQTMMNRIVCLMFRNTQGAVLPGDAPDEFFVRSADGGKFELRTPRTRYLGKIAQAFDRLQRYGLEGVLNGLAKYIQVSGDTRIAKRMKAWEVLRFMWDSSGAPSKCIVSASENSKMVEEEKAQEDQMRQAALAEQLARAGKDSAAASAQFNTDS